jgi:hypothetical protein
VEVVASLSQGRTAAAQLGLFSHKSVPVIFEPLCTNNLESQRCKAVSNINVIRKLILKTNFVQIIWNHNVVKLLVI